MRQAEREERQARDSDGVALKQVGVALGLVFAVTLAVIIGKQMSTEAMAVVIGVVCGVAAGIPTSILLVVALTRRERRKTEEAEAERLSRQGSYPPVIVIQGGAPQALPPGAQGGYWPAPVSWQPVRRDFHVVGGDDLLLDDRE